MWDGEVCLLGDDLVVPPLVSLLVNFRGKKRAALFRVQRSGGDAGERE